MSNYSYFDSNLESADRISDRMEIAQILSGLDEKDIFFSFSEDDSCAGVNNVLAAIYTGECERGVILDCAGARFENPAMLHKVIEKLSSYAEAVGCEKYDLDIFRAAYKKLEKMSHEDERKASEKLIPLMQHIAFAIHDCIRYA